tara:strand:- start:2007 stop:2270 length:264 start_codon:yes stop_codon:yes gene_type:complete
MDQIINCLLLKNGDLLISQIMEMDTELGGPDCKMIKPYKMVKEKDEYKFVTWLDYTSQTEMMIHSDSILTIVTPSSAILAEYLDLIA